MAVKYVLKLLALMIYRCIDLFIHLTLHPSIFSTIERSIELTIPHLSLYLSHPTPPLLYLSIHLLYPCLSLSLSIYTYMQYYHLADRFGKTFEEAYSAMKRLGGCKTVHILSFRLLLIYFSCLLDYYRYNLAVFSICKTIPHIIMLLPVSLFLI